MARRYNYGRDYDRDRPYGRDYERDRYGRRFGEERGRVYEFRPQRYSERDREDRGWWDRTRDEVASWFGDERAERRGHSQDRGYGREHESFSEIRAVDVMSRNVITAHPNDPVQHAARMMADCDCGSIPVVERDGRIIGMVTDRDITVRLVARGGDIRRARVEDCMTDEVFACHVYDPVEKCMREMARHQIRRLPVVDDRDRVVGIISQADIARHAGAHKGYGERRAMADTIYEISEPTDRPYQ